MNPMRSVAVLATACFLLQVAVCAGGRLNRRGKANRGAIGRSCTSQYRALATELEEYGSEKVILNSRESKNRKKKRSPNVYFGVCERCGQPVFTATCSKKGNLVYDGPEGMVLKSTKAGPVVDADWADTICDGGPSRRRSVDTEAEEGQVLQRKRRAPFC